VNNKQAAYKIFCDEAENRGINLETVKNKLIHQHIETPSWGYGNSGTRFKVFPYPGAARNIYEKMADAAYINRLCGIAPSVALHIPWDKVDDWNALQQYTAGLGLSIGAINPNLFQDEAYKLGSVCNPDQAVRQKAIEHLIDCCHIMKLTGSQILSIWLADGTNYAGQDSIASRKHRLLEALSGIYPLLPAGARMLLEYKFFEPAFYHTDLADWGMAFTLCQKLGPKAQVLVDTGHHAPGTNVAHIVAFLLDEERLGGFHFNSRQYADDDLIVGSANPWELFVIYHELVSAGKNADGVAYMIDQSHNIEPKLEAMLLSVLNCQSAYARALLVDRSSLAEAQLKGDVLGAYQVLSDAFQTDVRPFLAMVREEMGVPSDPLSYLRSDTYARNVADERMIDRVGSSGFPE
jgi:L-rhamnose isomerase / sugar isomerase